MGSRWKRYTQAFSQARPQGDRSCSSSRVRTGIEGSLKGQAPDMRTRGHAARSIEISPPRECCECWSVPPLRDRTGKSRCKLGDDLHVARRNGGDIVRRGGGNSSRLPLADSGWPKGRYALTAEQEKHGQQ